MKEIIIVNQSQLTYAQIGYILDNSENMIKHLDENIMYEQDNGYQFLFNVHKEETDDYIKWTFKSVGSYCQEERIHTVLIRMEHIEPHLKRIRR